MINRRLFRLAVVLGIIALLSKAGSLPSRGTPAVPVLPSALVSATGEANVAAADVLPAEAEVRVEDLLVPAPAGAGSDQVWVTGAFAALSAAEQHSVLRIISKQHSVLQDVSGQHSVQQDVSGQQSVQRGVGRAGGGERGGGRAWTGTLVVRCDGEELGRFTPADGTWRASSPAGPVAAGVTGGGT